MNHFYRWPIAPRFNRFAARLSIMQIVMYCLISSRVLTQLSINTRSHSHRIAPTTRDTQTRSPVQSNTDADDAAPKWDEIAFCASASCNLSDAGRQPPSHRQRAAAPSVAGEPEKPIGPRTNTPNPVYLHTHTHSRIGVLHAPVAEQRQSERNQFWHAFSIKARAPTQA